MQELITTSSVPLLASSKFKKLGLFLILLLTLVFFEDFLRMTIPFGNAIWLLVKDLLLVCLYSVSLIYIIRLSVPLKVPSLTLPILAYLMFSLGIYIYSAFGHENVPYGLTLIGARGDMFYVPLAFFTILALNWEKFPKLLFNIIIFALLVNLLAACMQIIIPDITKNIPGLYGLNEEGLFSQKGRSYGYTLLDYLFGLFGTVAKFTRNILHMFVWVLVLHLAFKLGKQWPVLAILFFIGPILALSGKRLPALIWLMYVIYIPIIIIFMRTFWRVALIKKSVQNKFIVKLKNKIVFMLFTVFSLSVAYLVFSENAQIYLEMFKYLITNEIQMRFLSEDAKGYFFQAELNSIDHHEAIFGQGAGTSSIGAQYILSETEMLIAGFKGVEHGPVKVWLEFGLLGLIQMAILLLGIIYIDLKVMRRALSSPRLFVASNMIFIYHISVFMSFFVGHSYWSDVQIQIHFWMLTGLQIWIFSSLRKSISDLKMK